MNKQDLKKKEVRPIKTIRCGAIAAHIWERQSQTGYTYYEYSLSRSWKSSKSEKQGYSQNFYTRNREQLVTCVEEATAFITNLMNEFSLTDDSEAASDDATQPIHV